MRFYLMCCVTGTRIMQNVSDSQAEFNLPFQQTLHSIKHCGNVFKFRLYPVTFFFTYMFSVSATCFVSDYFFWSILFKIERLGFTLSGCIDIIIVVYKNLKTTNDRRMVYRNKLRNSKMSKLVHYINAFPPSGKCKLITEGKTEAKLLPWIMVASSLVIKY